MVETSFSDANIFNIFLEGHYFLDIQYFAKKDPGNETWPNLAPGDFFSIVQKNTIHTVCPGSSDPT